LFLLGGIGGVAAWKGLAQQLTAPAGKIGDPACVLTGELEEGPYYLDLEMLRRDITERKPGVPLRLRIAVVDGKSCQPVPDAAVDIWHCDAVGLYSGSTASAPPDGAGRGPGRGRGPGGPGGSDFGPPPGPPPGFDFAGRGPGRGRGATDKFTFLRGVQITDKNGMAEFETVYPGWYAGRTIHIHAKIHLGGAAADTKYSGGHVAHTGQFFFPEDVTEAIAKLDPYTTHKAYRTLNEQDGIYRQAHGAGGMLALDRGEKSLAAGMIGTVTIAVDPDATPRAVGMGRGGPGPGR
jgi:protocatechuate 3,4-dioxygenase beta subunit